MNHLVSRHGRGCTVLKLGTCSLLEHEQEPSVQAVRQRVRQRCRLLAHPSVVAMSQR